MKLLSEQLVFNQPLSIIEEASEDNKEKRLYIQGIFAQAELKNRNERIYPRQVLGAAVDKYITEYVNQHKALGELSHPNSHSINPDRACILIESLDWCGNNLLGKAKVLNTPAGQLLASLIKDGVQLGVSTRGFGNVKKVKAEDKSMIEMVENYEMRAIDVVTSPSGIDCFVNGIMESKEYEIDGDNIIERIIEKQPETPIIEECKFNSELFTKELKNIFKK